MRVLFWQNTKGGIIAVETINYNRFKESCEEFKSAFSDSFFSSGRLFCHPLLDGLIYTPCSPEEAKSNSISAAWPICCLCPLTERNIFPSR